MQPVLMRYPNSLVSDNDRDAQFMLAERTENILLAQIKYDNSANCLFVPICAIKVLDFILKSSPPPPHENNVSALKSPAIVWRCEVKQPRRSVIMLSEHHNPARLIVIAL